MIDGSNFFNQPVKNDLSTYYDIRKIAIRQGDDYTSFTRLSLFQKLF